MLYHRGCIDHAESVFADPYRGDRLLQAGLGQLPVNTIQVLEHRGLARWFDSGSLRQQGDLLWKVFWSHMKIPKDDRQSCIRELFVNF